MCVLCVCLQIQLPGASLDVDTATYARIICGLLDIPVHSNVIESLHHLFLLYADFESNPHFRNQVCTHRACAWCVCVRC